MNRFAKLVARIVVAAIAAGFTFASAHAQERETHERAHHADAHEHAQADATPEQAMKKDTQSPSTDHVAPLPPQHPMEPMSGREMIDAMEMDDAASIATMRFDRLERVDGDDGVATAWKFAATVGGDFDKLLVRSEGEHTRGA